MHRKGTTHWHSVAQARHTFSDSDTDALVTLSAIELRTFLGGITQRDQNGGGNSKEFVFASCNCKFAKARAEDEATAEVSGN
jgi:hypothetical protein